MKNSYLRIGGTGLLLAAVGAGMYGLRPENTSSKKLEFVTIAPGRDDNSPDNLVQIDLDQICGVAGSSSHDDYFLRLSSLLDAQGKPLFTCEEKLALMNMRIDIKYIEELTMLKNREGKNFFTGKDVIAYHQAKGDVDYAGKAASILDAQGNFMFRGDQMAQMYALGIAPEEMLGFKDTSKPNALLIYPAKDNEYGTFRNNDIVAFHNKLKDVYDLKIRVARQEHEVYEALDSSQNTDLLVLLGHGVPDSLSLGENDLRYASAENDETYRIDISDSELKQHLQHLNHSATILLYSCSTGRGREMGKNLANAVAEWAPGRTIIAPTKDIRTSDVRINTVFPFEVTLFYKDDTDATYVVSKH